MLKLSEQKRVAALLQKYIFSQAKGELLSTEDQEALDQWRGTSEENEALFHSLMNRKQIRADLNEMALIQSRVKHRWDKLSPRLTDNQRIPTSRSYLVLILSLAACAVGALLVLLFWPHNKPLVAKAQTYTPATHSIAELVYSDGRRVELDSMGMGTVLSEEGTVIKKVDSSTLQYLSGSAGISHTIHTPRGGKYTVILPDGSSVCLNAASTLTYPTEFGSVSREVRLEGEGFFKVAHQAGAPFVVHTDKENIEDLATSFDVKNYSDESTGYTTLIAGSIRVLAGEQSEVLHPGQQAVSKASGGFTVTQIDTFATTAWVTGRLSFSDQPLSLVLKQLSRWYDVEVVYKDKTGIGDPVFGYSTVKSTSALSDVLSHINHMMNLHCSYDDAARAIVVDR
jgi:ferric-dicitrate binding protein FerR (iron transport regulator)